MNLEKYIGVPFKKFGRSLVEGVDCYGLILNFYKDELGIDIPNFTRYDFNSKSISDQVYAALEDMFKPIKGEFPNIYDIGLLSFAGAPTHVVMYIGEQRILHIMIDEDSVVEKMDSPRLRGRWYGWYRKSSIL